MGVPGDDRGRARRGAGRHGVHVPRTVDQPYARLGTADARERRPEVGLAPHRVVDAHEHQAGAAPRHARHRVVQQIHPGVSVGPLGRGAVDARVVLPIAERRDRRSRAARLARPGDEGGEVAPLIADVPDQGDHVGSLARQRRQGRAGGRGHPAVQVHVGDAGEAQPGERGREAGHRQVVVCDFEGGGLDEESVAQSGRRHRARGGGEEGAAGKGEGKGDHGAEKYSGPGPVLSAS